MGLIIQGMEENPIKSATSAGSMCKSSCMERLFAVWMFGDGSNREADPRIAIVVDEVP